MKKLVTMRYPMKRFRSIVRFVAKAMATQHTTRIAQQHWIRTQVASVIS
jgi:hypothetical protein